MTVYSVTITTETGRGKTKERPKWVGGNVKRERVGKCMLKRIFEKG
jgi:hypothetical protein